MQTLCCFPGSHLRITNGAAIADSFALGEVHKVTHAADGMMARIWRLDSALGSFAVKAFRDFVDVDELASRLEVSTQVADTARDAGVVSPRALRASGGELVLRVGNADDTTNKSDGSHRDFFPGDVLCRDGQVVGLVDWDEIEWTP